MEHADAVERMLRVANVDKVCELARILGVKAQTVSNWKKRGVPPGEIIRLSRLTGVSAQWLETGHGQKGEAESSCRPRTNVQLLTSAMRQVEEVLGELGEVLSVDKRVALAAQIYDTEMEGENISRTMIKSMVSEALAHATYEHNV